MATTVATSASAIITRLNVGSATLEPSAANVQTWVRDGFREGWASFQPPFKNTGTITSDAVTQAADRILYVVVDGLVLIEGEEWQHGASGVTDLPRRYTGKTATIYYCNVPDLTGATIESSCVLGDDWLEPYVLLHATAVVYERLSNTAPSQGADRAGAMLRIAEDRRDKLAARMQNQRANWEQRMENMLARRMALGPRVRRDAAWTGFTVRGGMSNELTASESPQ